MSFDPFSQGAVRDPIISIGKSKIRQSYIDSHIKLEEFGKEAKCPKCPMTSIDGGLCENCQKVFTELVIAEDEEIKKYNESKNKEKV